MGKCSCFVEKIVLRIFTYIFSPNFFSAIVFLSLRNIPSVQHYVLLILWHSREKRARILSIRAFFARLTRMP